MLKVFFSGMMIGINGFLSVLPVYETLSGVSELLISLFFGIPTIIVSIVFLIPTIIFVIKKIIHR